MTSGKSLAWGARVSAEFRRRVVDIAARISVEPNDLMACIAFETGRSFRAHTRNGAGSGAVGLIQFMPLTALSFFYTAEQLRGMTSAEQRSKGFECAVKMAAMSDVEQLDYVLRYFQPYKGRLRNLGDLYMSILWPAGIGKNDDFVLFDIADLKRPKLYIQNKGLDYNKNGQITRGEACKRVYAELIEGLKPGNVESVA